MPETLVVADPEHVATHWLVAAMHRGKTTLASPPSSPATPKMAFGPPPVGAAGAVRGVRAASRSEPDGDRQAAERANGEEMTSDGHGPLQRRKDATPQCRFIAEPTSKREARI